MFFVRFSLCSGREKSTSWRISKMQLKKKKSITEPPIAKLEDRELRRGIVHFQTEVAYGILHEGGGTIPGP